MLSLLLLLGSTRTSNAKTGTWLSNPISKNWSTKMNWNPVTLPNGPTETATFNTSSRTTILITFPLTIATTVFNPGASPYGFSVVALRSMTFTSLGISNNSAVVQSFLNAGTMSFTRSSTAGVMTSFTITGGTTDGGAGGLMTFHDLGSAGTGTFVVNAATILNAGGGEIDFSENGNGSGAVFTVKGATLAGGNAGAVKFTSGSLAGHATYEIQGGAVAGATGASMSFTDSASANQATITTQGASVSGAIGGTTDFLGGTAANSVLIANGGSNGGGGGTIRFEGTARGGSSRVEVFGNGTLDLSASSNPDIMIGSLEGDGDVTLGTRGLVIGANSVNTTFSGLIHGDGSVTKTGDSVFTFASGNTYTGGTVISSGTVLAENKNDSCTGSGLVQLNGGFLGGQGTIGGPVRVGLGDGSVASLAAAKGSSSTATLTIQGLLTFNLGGDFTFKVKSGTRPTSDSIVANGVVIGSGATFSFLGVGSGTIDNGRVIVAISNTSASPIAGAFSNLADGATFTANGISYQANYEGGDGNDLTLTVVP